MKSNIPIITITNKNNFYDHVLPSEHSEIPFQPNDCQYTIKSQWIILWSASPPSVYDLHYNKIQDRKAMTFLFCPPTRWQTISVLLQAHSLSLPSLYFCPFPPSSTILPLLLLLSSSVSGRVYILWNCETTDVSTTVWHLISQPFTFTEFWGGV